MITLMRNEAAFILEWLAYHTQIGFTDFLIYSHDCEDGTDVMLDRLQELGVVFHHPIQRSGKKAIQWEALSNAVDQPVTREADWIFVADIDEFLCVNTGDGTLRSLIDARPDAEAFLISWRMFGNNGKVAYKDELNITRFTRCAPERMLWPWRAVQYKTLWRNKAAKLEKLGVHRPRFKSGPKKLVHVDSSGRNIQPGSGTVLWDSKPRYELAQINHYAVSSVENFLVKADRGKPNHTNDATDLDYWIDRNFNQIEDRRILDFEGRVRDQIGVWRADTCLEELHQNAVSWRKKRIETLLNSTDNIYLYGRIIQAGPTVVLPMWLQSQLSRRLLDARRNGPDTL